MKRVIVGLVFCLILLAGFWETLARWFSPTASMRSDEPPIRVKGGD